MAGVHVPMSSAIARAVRDEARARGRTMSDTEARAYAAAAFRAAEISMGDPTPNTVTVHFVDPHGDRESVAVSVGGPAATFDPWMRVSSVQVGPR